MPSCGCAGTSCSCLVTPGAGIKVNGTGTAANPYVIEASASSIGGLIQVLDTPTLNLTMIGVGSPTEPYVISGVTTGSSTLVGLSDVSDPTGPVAGDVPIWVTSGTPHWEFQPPPTTPPGAVTPGAGLTGDGSGANPLKVSVSGTWGTSPLHVYGTLQTVGAPIYVDSAGQLRARPMGFEPVTDGTRPNQYPGRVIYETTSHAIYISDGTTWTPLTSGAAGGGIDAGQITSGVLALARIPSLPAGQITTGVLAAAQIPALDASKITTGTFPVAQIPNLAASKITSGVLADNLGGTGLANVYSGRTFSTAATGAPRLIAVDSGGNLGSVTGALHSTMIPNYLYAQYVTTTAYAHEAGSSRYAMWMDSGLNMGRATSSRRVKDRISDWQPDVDKVLAIPVRRFHRIVDPKNVWDYGGIAEEVEDAGLTELLYRDESGKPDGIKDHLLVWALLAVVKKQNRRIAALEKKGATS